MNDPMHFDREKVSAIIGSHPDKDLILSALASVVLAPASLRDAAMRSRDAINELVISCPKQYENEGGYLGNPQMCPKRKPCGRARRRRPSPCSKASHHYARFAKRQRNRRRKAKAKKVIDPWRLPSKAVPLAEMFAQQEGMRYLGTPIRSAIISIPTMSEIRSVASAHLQRSW